MSYFIQKLDKLSSDYGHLTGTLVCRIQQTIDAKNAFETAGTIIMTKNNAESILSSIESIRKHCEFIDAVSGSMYVVSIDKFRNTLRNKTLNTIDLLMKNALRKDFDSCTKLLAEISHDLSPHTDTVLELISLKATFDLRTLPLDCLEFFETGEMRFIGRIFLSYCMKDENEILISSLVSPFLEELGFQTVYASRDFSPNKTPGQNAEELIKKCGTLIAYLTQDQGVYPSANVIHEIGVASDKVVILFAEKGAIVPPNLSTSATYYTFERQNTGEMLLKLIRSLRLANIYKVPKHSSM
jgi:hypothetical protein